MELRGFIAALACGLVVGCSGGGGGGLHAPTELAVSYDVKAYAFSWDPVGGATHYQVSEDPDGPGPEGGNVVGEQITATNFKLTLDTLLHRRLNAQYFVRACNGLACGAPASVQPDVVRAIGYFKAGNAAPNGGYAFGHAISVSDDGATMAVGAPHEDGASTGVNGDANLKGQGFAGAVYVFIRSGSTWVQQAYIKPHNTEVGDQFGRSVALSSDGNTLVVGAPFEDSSHEGVTPASLPDEDDAEDSGAAYVFTRANGEWSQQVYVKASNTGVKNYFGRSVSLSSDGSTLAVSALGADDIPSDNVSDFVGAVYVFSRDGADWAEQAKLNASNPRNRHHFGYALSLSADGNTLAVSAQYDHSNATGVGGDQGNTSASYSGAVYVFGRTGNEWSQQPVYIKASNTGAEDLFGTSLMLSADGNTLAVGAVGERSRATGVNGDQLDDAAFDAGAVYVFTRSDGQWSQQAYVKPSNTDAGDQFGYAVALAGDGNTLAVSAPQERSASRGVNGDGASNEMADVGAVYLFVRRGTSWSQQAYLKASNASPDDKFGEALALSAGGRTLAVGSPREKSSASGINGNQGDRSIPFAGAVYMY